MTIALAVRRRANCVGSRVGAVLVLKDRIISTGYNGTPEGMKNCDEGGCDRCARRESFESGRGYDVCVCVHAEQNALLSAARFGIPVEGADLYTTTRPCFGCMKELLQVGVQKVYYLHDWEHPDPELHAQYRALEVRFPEGVKRVEIEDPEEAWAVAGKEASDAPSGSGTP